MMPALSPPPLTIDEVAERWHYSADSIRRLIRADLLGTIRLSRQKVLVHADDAAAYERHALRREPFAMAVYFAQAEHSRLVKIGTSLNVRERMQGLRTSNSERVFVLALCPGYLDLERHFHTKFAAERSHGEWFKLSRRLRSQMAAIKDAFGLPEWANV